MEYAISLHNNYLSPSILKLQTTFDSIGSINLAKIQIPHPTWLPNTIHQYVSSVWLWITTLLTALHITPAILIGLLYVLVIVRIWRHTARNKSGGIRPRFLQLVESYAHYRSAILTFITTLPVLSFFYSRYFAKQLAGFNKTLRKDLQASRDPRQMKRLPEDGLNEQSLKKRLREWGAAEEELWGCGRLSGSIYCDQATVRTRVANYSSQWAYCSINTDADEIRRMRREILSMTGGMLIQEAEKEGGALKEKHKQVLEKKQLPYGIITSGGTESLILALYAYKKYAQATMGVSKASKFNMQVEGWVRKSNEYALRFNPIVLLLS